MSAPHCLPTPRREREIRTEAIPKDLLELVRQQASEINRLKAEVAAVQATLNRLREVVS